MATKKAQRHTTNIGPYSVTDCDYGVDGGAPSCTAEDAKGHPGMYLTIALLGSSHRDNGGTGEVVGWWEDGTQSEENQERQCNPTVVTVGGWNRLEVMGAVLEVATALNAPAPLGLLAGVKTIAGWKGWW